MSTITPGTLARDMAPPITANAGLSELLAALPTPPSATVSTEWLAIGLFAHTEAIAASGLPDFFKSAAIQELIALVAQQGFPPEHRQQFVDFFYGRVQQYGPATGDPSRLALLFAENLASSPDIAVAYAARMVFHKRFMAAVQFANNVAQLVAQR